MCTEGSRPGGESGSLGCGSLVAGPDKLASILRRGLLDAPWTSKSVVLDIGHSDSIPGHIRRVVWSRAPACLT